MRGRSPRFLRTPPPFVVMLSILWLFFDRTVAEVRGSQRKGIIIRVKGRERFIVRTNYNSWFVQSLTTLTEDPGSFMAEPPGCLDAYLCLGDKCYRRNIWRAPGDGGCGMCIKKYPHFLNSHRPACYFRLESCTNIQSSAYNFIASCEFTRNPAANSTRFSEHRYHVFIGQCSFYEIHHSKSHLWTPLSRFVTPPCHRTHI